MNDNIWLVIWDLDRTFLNGGLNSGDQAQFAEIIKALVSRGIMNSCCSRGTFQAAQNKLDEMGVWDYIVFPCVNTYPLSKADRVEQIIKNTRLRPQYALYLDNDAFNRKLSEAALPNLNTAPPSEIFSLSHQPEFKGFADKIHVRLAQYKLTKPMAEAKTASGFRTMAHAVMECSIVECDPYIADIRGIFAEPSPINYTGGQLSADGLAALLNDPGARNGCITLKDIYKDRGVVGFYSSRDNRLEHFIFSGELADIPGVEQWAYAKLGYPMLTKTKSCAGEVDSSGAPDWINQIGGDAKPSGPAARLQLLMRGGEELRGLMRCLTPYVTVTPELFDRPTSLCYAVKGQSYSDYDKETIYKYIPSLDPDAFSTDMFSGSYDYVLVSVLTERSMIKYLHKADSSLAAYLPKELAESQSAEFFDAFESYVYSDDELDDSLQYICDNLPGQTSLIIMTAPEVTFTRVSESEGGDPDRYSTDCQRRARYNAITEDVVVRNSNAYLLDIRNLVKSEADLSDFHILHYDRQIDQDLSRVLTALMSVKTPEPAPKPSAAPLAEAPVPEIDIKLQYRSFVVNGLFVTQVKQPEQPGFTFSFSVMLGSQAIEQTGFSTETLHEARINAFGVYWARVSVRHKSSEHYFDTPYFVYNAKTVFNYIDKTAPNFSNIHRGHLLPLFEAADSARQLDHDLATELRALLAVGSNVFDYFERRGDEEICILSDPAAATLIMDSADNTKIRIKGLFTLDKPFTAAASLGTRQYRFSALKKDSLGEGDTLFAACLPGSRGTAEISASVSNKVKIVWLHSVLHTLSTDRFFTAGIRESVARKGGCPVIVLRLPTIRGLRSPAAEDRALMPLNTAKLATAAESDVTALPHVFDGVPYDKLTQTAILPPTALDGDGIWKFADRAGDYMNIAGGLRHTEGQPAKYIGSVYMFGGSMVFGKLCSDGETIASKLQASLNLPLRVVNCSNYDGRMQASRMMTLLDSVSLGPNDIVIIAMEEDQMASTIIPFQFRYLDDTFLKVDALTALNGASGAFYMNNVYSPKGNGLIADLLREKIYGLIRLFS